MMQYRAQIGVSIGGLVLGVAAIWMMQPSVDPGPSSLSGASEPVARAVGAPSGALGESDEERGKGKARGKGKGRPRAARGEDRLRGKAEAEAELLGERREPELEPEDRAALRKEVREDRAAELSAKIDRYASDAGWDPALTARVQEVIDNTTDKITRNLARVDRGEVEWSDIRHDMRQHRIDQARRIRDLLGEDEFGVFAEEMGLDRFSGDRPVRGRLE